MLNEEKKLRVIDRKKYNWKKWIFKQGRIDKESLTQWPGTAHAR